MEGYEIHLESTEEVTGSESGIGQNLCLFPQLNVVTVIILVVAVVGSSDASAWVEGSAELMRSIPKGN